MTCPYCTGEMQLGRIEGDARRAITWKAYREQTFFQKVTDTLTDSYDKLLCGDNLIRHTHIDAHFCSACNKMIIDVPTLGSKPIAENL